MQNYNHRDKDYSGHVVVMVSTDRSVFTEGSAVRARMVDYARGYKELHIIVFSRKRFATTEIAPQCFAYSTNSFSPLSYVSSAVRLGKRIFKKLPKELPILVTCQDPFETALVGKCLAHTRQGVELLIQIHTDIHSPYFTRASWLNKARLFISQYTLSQADAIQVVSERIAHSLVKKGIEASKIFIKPITVDTERIKSVTSSFNLHERFPHYNPLILMVCRLEREKNIEMALDALKILRTNRPTIGMVVVGGGSQENHLKRYASLHGLESAVTYVGEQKDTVSYYKGCDVFLMTSWYEGYGMVLKEAEAAGCRIVSTDVGIAREVGAVIAEHTAADIAQKLSSGLP